MTNLSSLFKAMNLLHSQHQEPSLVPAVSSFPFPTMYPGQLECYNKMKDFEGTVALTSHTGAGKSALFLSLIYNNASIIIEPRKFLQKQISGYRDDFVLYGKSEYPCPHSPSHRASTAPCSTKILCNTTEYSKTCPTKTKTCLEKPCKVFKTEGGFEKYPCNGCKYLAAQAEARRVLGRNGTVICNFGNFWTLLKYADIVVIDEADLFFREISKPTVIHYTRPKDLSDLESE